MTISLVTCHTTDPKEFSVTTKNTKNDASEGTKHNQTSDPYVSVGYY